MIQELHTSKVGPVVCRKYLVQKKTSKVEHLQESGKEVPKAMNVPVKDFNWFKGWFDESDDMIRTEDYEKEKKNIK